MRLPSAERAVVDEAKVRGYLLAAKHPVSRFKAAFFRTLVYTPTDWLHLQQSLVAHALTAEAIPESASPYGQKFRIRAMLQGPGAIRGGGLDSDHPCWGRLAPIGDSISWRQPMSLRELDTIVLERDLPTHALRRGDVGAVVAVHSPTTVEVEFVRASGHTQALVELATEDLRLVSDDDLLAVRRLDPSSRGAA